MPIQSCKLTIDSGQHELEMRGTPMFPCGAYFSNIGENLTGEIPWHWHDEIEVLVVHSGIIHINLTDMELILKEGEGVFINSNVLHSAQVVDNTDCTLHSLVYHTSLISGAAESVFEQRYIRPLVNRRSLPAVPLYCENEWQQEAIQYVQEAYKAYKTEKFGYEFIVRENLSHVWYLIITNNLSFLEEKNQSETQDTIRIKTMMNFLHQHYSESLDLDDIANIANISERECLRCFQRTIGISPMQYLLKHRVSVSALLLLDTDLPIAEICTLSGFDSPSYFSKIFKRFMLYSPTIYRKSKGTH